MISMSVKGLVVAAAVAAITAIGGTSAQAATVALKNGADGGGIDRATVTCAVGCDGWLFDAKSLGGGIGGLIDKHDQNYAAGTGEAWEKNLLESIAGATLAYSKSGSNPATTFVSDALYILFRIGVKPDVGLIVNTSGVAQEYSFAEVGGTGSGLSHYAEYGSVAPVPVPAGLPLLLTGIAALGVWRRRSRKAA